MAFLHRYYFFNRKKVELILSGVGAEGETVLAAGLLCKAKHAVQENGRWSTEFLDNICFCDEWLEPSEPDVDNIENWLLVAISQAIVGREELPHVSFAVLKAV